MRMIYEQQIMTLCEIHIHKPVAAPHDIIYIDELFDKCVS